MRHLVLAVCFGIGTGLVAQQKKPAITVVPRETESAAGRLPVKRVVLYKNGVGYFEHVGKVRGSQDVNVDFTTSQLNDVLKSLAIVDIGGGRINSVRYNSVAPLSEQLKSLRLGIDGQTNSYQFLNSLRGAKVEVRSGATSVVGRVLSVERKQKKKDDEVVRESDELTVVSDAGEVRTFILGPATSVRILDKELSSEVGRYMGLISSTRERDLRRMTIATEGAGERSVFVSYISEVPIWKSTYRIILPSKKDSSPILQGWAIVDNTIGEDWKDVELSLVAGAPQSFVQNLSQPYYTQRPVVELPKSVQLTPQTHEGTMEEEEAPPPVASASKGVVGGVGGGIAGGYGGGAFRISPTISMGIAGVVLDPAGAVVPSAHVTVTDKNTGAVIGQGYSDSAGRFSIPTQPGMFAVQVDASGFQTWRSQAYVSSGQVRQISATLHVSAATESVEVSAEDAEVEAEAEGKPLAEMFEYELKDKVTIGKNQSALVPIISGKIDAEKVTVWNPSQSAPMRALWINNTSGLTLDAGTFNIIEQGTFGGEGVWEVLKPAEKRLISYAAEDAIRIKSLKQDEEGNVSHVKVIHGVMTETQRRGSTTRYTVRNEDSLERTVIVEHPCREGWKLSSKVKPAESSQNFHRFRVHVDPKASAELEVEEVQDEENTWQLSNLSDEELKLFVSRKAITPELESQLRKVVEQKKQVDAINVEISTRNSEFNRISQEQGRLRENMKALKGSAEEKQLTQRYVRELNDQEDELQRLRKEINDLQSRRQAAQIELGKTVEAISFDQDI